MSQNIQKVSESINVTSDINYSLGDYRKDTEGLEQFWQCISFDNELNSDVQDMHIDEQPNNALLSTPVNDDLFNCESNFDSFANTIEECISIDNCNSFAPSNIGTPDYIPPSGTITDFPIDENLSTIAYASNHVDAIDEFNADVVQEQHVDDSQLEPEYAHYSFDSIKNTILKSPKHYLYKVLLLTDLCVELQFLGQYSNVIDECFTKLRWCNLPPEFHHIDILKTMYQVLLSKAQCLGDCHCDEKLKMLTAFRDDTIRKVCYAHLYREIYDDYNYKHYLFLHKELKGKHYMEKFFIYCAATAGSDMFDSRMARKYRQHYLGIVPFAISQLKRKVDTFSLSTSANKFKNLSEAENAGVHLKHESRAYIRELKDKSRRYLKYVDTIYVDLTKDKD